MNPLVVVFRLFGKTGADDTADFKGVWWTVRGGYFLEQTKVRLA